MYEVKLPQTSEDHLESVIVFWHKAEGDTVSKGDVLVEVQTEKAVFEIEAEESGIIGKILVPRGGVARVGDVLTTISPAAQADSTNDAKPKGEEKTAITNQTGEGDLFIKAPPRIRRLARELGVDLAVVKGTGRNGLVTEEDVRRAVNQESKPSYIAVPFTPVRKTIAKRMADSLSTSAQLTETAWADVTLLAEERNRLLEKLTWNDILLFAATKSLKAHPNINAHIMENEIYRFEKVHLGVAVDTEDGLYVPVVKNADELSINQLREQVRLLIEKAARHQLAADDLTGATFTVTNLGSFGIQFFTPIINRPEAAILGAGSIESDLVLKDGKIAERKRMPLSLTFDHRVIDGAPAAKFLQSVIHYLQEPALLLEEVSAK